MTFIVAFYSYKGGVGRTMALANTGYVLAQRGYRVLLVDFDLEAPGLTHFFSDQVERHAQVGALDSLEFLIRAKSELPSATRWADASETLSLDRFIVNIPLSDGRAKLAGPYYGGHLDLMPASLSTPGRDYLKRLDELNLPSVFVAGSPHEFGTHLRQYFARARTSAAGDPFFTLRDHVLTEYDYVLIDSRTGLTEIAGLCAGPMTDLLLICTGFNRQNVAGTRYFIRRVGLLSERSKKAFVLIVSPVPPWHATQAYQHFIPLAAELSALSPDRYVTPLRLRGDGGSLNATPAFELLEVPYHPRAAISETIFAVSEPNDLIVQAYHRVATTIVSHVERVASQRDEAAADVLRDIMKGSHHPRATRAPNLSFLRAREASRELLNTMTGFPTGITLATASALNASPSDSTLGLNRLVLGTAVAALRLHSFAPFKRCRDLAATLGRDLWRKRLAARLLFMELRVAAALRRIGATPSTTFDVSTDYRILRNAMSAIQEPGRASEDGIPLALDAWMTLLLLQEHKMLSGQALTDVSADLRFRLRRSISVSDEPPFARSKWWERVPDILPLIMKSEVNQDERFQLRGVADSIREDLEDRPVLEAEGPPLYVFDRRDMYPVGLWPESIAISVLALAYGPKAAMDVGRWVDVARGRYGYAWRVLIDWRHFGKVSGETPIRHLLAEEDTAIARVENAIDCGEVLL